MKKTKILIPVYNDWKSVFKLLEEINVQLDGWEADISVVIINDASTEERPINNYNGYMNFPPVKLDINFF